MTSRVKNGSYGLATRLGLSLLLGLLLPLSACSSGLVHAPSLKEMEERGESAAGMAGEKSFVDSEASWLGGRRVGLVREERESPLLQTRVTLAQRGSLRQIAASIAKIAPVSVLVAEEEAESPQLSGSGELQGLDGLLGEGAGAAGVLDLSYSGPLRGLLDRLSSLSGLGWDYEPEAGRVVFALTQTRTFTISASLGETSWEARLSSLSRERQGSSLSGSGLNAVAQSGDASSQTAQSTVVRAQLELWKEVEASVKALLSRRGSVSVDRGAGAITVRDHWRRMREVERYVRETNARLERQVAVSVRVWALELTDSSSAQLNLHALLSSAGLSAEAGSELAETDGLATVSVVTGRLSGSSAALKALGQWGRATQLTSASGLVMNNQAFPVQAVRRLAYLAGASLSTSEYSQTSELTPGEVTTGFSMTLVPHILPDRQVLLQYSLSLSSLEEMSSMESGNVKVQLPQVATRAFSQRSRLRSGQSLVLAGFEQSSDQASRNLGLLMAGGGSSKARTLLVVSIELEGADGV